MSMRASRAWKESCWRHYLGAGPPPEVIRSAVGAVGMMQINGRVWRGVYDLALLESDVRYNVDAGVVAARFATTCAVITGHGVEGARSEFAAENIALRHAGNATRA